MILNDIFIFFLLNTVSISDSMEMFIILFCLGFLNLATNTEALDIAAEAKLFKVE